MTRLAWGLSAVLALAGIATYAVSGSKWAWWAGLALVAPVAVLAVRRASKRGAYRGRHLGGDGGAWGPP